MTETEDDLAAVWERERRFHDDLAGRLAAEPLPEPARNPLVDALVPPGEALEGLRVLDLGCGVGDLSMLLAGRGARVTGIDISPGMTALAERRLRERLPDADATFVAAPVERSGLPDAAFDLIVGRYVLHHLDPASAGREMARVLRPGGRGRFLETSAANRLLMLARDRVAGRYGVPRYGTADEHPLDAAVVAQFAQPFAEVRLEHPVFEFLSLFDRQVLRYRSPRASRALRRGDALLGRIPPLRRYSYRVVVELRRGADAGAAR
jgi:SAM-dependent methyltransferase